MSPDTPVRVLRARWVFPVDQPPLADGVVEIQGNRIVAVRPYHAGESVDDLGDVALLPGLVNAHTHLEFSRIEQPLGEPGIPFPNWIQLVLDYRQSEEIRTGDPSQWRTEGVSEGIAESKAAGVVALGEIASSGWPEAVINSSTLQFTVFAELLGLAPERIEPLWQAGSDHIAAGQLVECRWNPGLSPHAPYTVHPELLARVCQYAAAEHFPVAMHLAESLEEIELLLSGSGAMVEFLERKQAFPRDLIRRGTRPLDYLRVLAQAGRALVVHGTFLSDEEIAFCGERSQHLSVVYCPRTHAHFCAGRYRLANMLAANVNVCLGTDSKASNPDLRLFEEMRFVTQRHEAVSPEGALYLGTQAGADALGINAQFGSITPGKSGKLTLVTLGRSQANDPHELLFDDGTLAGPLEYDLV
jgi:cytosine/adenosine deaminase-related metal-dependent hydrolase